MFILLMTNVERLPQTYKDILAMLCSKKLFSKRLSYKKANKRNQSELKIRLANMMILLYPFILGHSPSHSHYGANTRLFNMCLGFLQAPTVSSKFRPRLLRSILHNSLRCQLLGFAHSI